MLSAQKCLEIARKRGKANQDINRVYRMLKCQELYLIAYGKLSSNHGALTPGVDPEDTVDGMAMKRIDAIIEKLDKGCYTWKPSRRIYIDKKHSTTKRPLSMPTWSDKLLQEVMRMILEAYYDPQFRKSSHGFRPHKGCHTALKEIQRIWTGTKWFIETDIKGCFANIHHKILLEILSRKIKDERFLKLLKGMLNAGYMEQGIHYNTYSGTPQGGNISPLLANIVLHEFDTFVEDELLPKYNIGKKKKKNPDYVKLENIRAKAKKHHQKWVWNEAGKRMREIPSRIADDPKFKRLRYMRYADDSILGLDGSKADAENIKQEIGNYLQRLGLEMSQEKTLITHAGTEKARFLNYEISINWDNTRQTVTTQGIKKRSINGGVVLEMPNDVYNEWKARVQGNNGRITHRPALLYLSDYDIVATYEVELQGLINYYTLAHDVYRKGMSLRFFWQQSLLRTLARKHKTSAAKMYRKYHYTTENRKTVAVIIERKKKKPLVTIFGKKPIERNLNAVIDDEVKHIFAGRTQLVERMLADTCEICGSRHGVEVHHIRKLKDLRKRWQGRKEKPEWVSKMIAIRRKTLVVCQKHHHEIHAGNYDGEKLDESLLESWMQ